MCMFICVFFRHRARRDHEAWFPLLSKLLVARTPLVLARSYPFLNLPAPLPHLVATAALVSWCPALFCQGLCQKGSHDRQTGARVRITPRCTWLLSWPPPSQGTWRGVAASQGCPLCLVTYQYQLWHRPWVISTAFLPQWPQSLLPQYYCLFGVKPSF